MKTEMRWGVGNIWLLVIRQRAIRERGIRECALVLATAALVACGGSGSGGNNPVDSSVTPVNPEQTFAVSGTANGLAGAIQLGDGFQTLDISADGAFAFTHQYRKGDTFALKVDTGATDQLCTVSHGAGLVLGDIKDVSVDCLETRAVNIRVSKPKPYTTFNALDLRSSYQFVPKLASETTSLVVAKNQFVSLYPTGAQSRPIYLAFIKSFDETTVDALSTAVSLVLLSPSIHGAIEQRGAHFESFIGRFAALPAVIALKDAIATKADAGQLNLQAPSTDLLSLLDSAVTAAADDIISSDSAAAKTDVSRAAASANKVHIAPAGSQDGLSLMLQKITPDAAGNNYQLQINNAQQRFIAIESPLLAEPVAIGPGESHTQAFKSDAVNELWTVRGPGAQAATAPVSSLLKEAVINTATQFYATPSLAFMAGNIDSLGWRLLSCSDAAELQQFSDDTKAALLSDETLESALSTPHYTAAYDAVAAPLRASVISHLHDLMACEYFRKGHWLEEHAATAAVQIGTMLSIAQAIYMPRTNGANVLVKAGLLAAGGVINTSLTEQPWQLSNTLDLVIAQNVNGVESPVSGTLTINKGETLQLTASCVDPVSKSIVDCAVQWTSSQGSIQAKTFSEVLSSSDVVTIVATDDDGGTSSRSIAVTVLELPPEPPQSTGYWVLDDGSTAQRFDVTSAQFLETLSNDGSQVTLAEFRGYVNDSGVTPYISISLPQLGNPGTYALDDIAGRSCLGFVFLADQPWPWCTNTTGPFAAAPVTGSANYSVGAEGLQIVDFDFHVVPPQCAQPQCNPQHVTGHIEARAPLH